MFESIKYGFINLAVVLLAFAIGTAQGNYQAQATFRTEHLLVEDTVDVGGATLFNGTVQIDGNATLNGSTTTIGSSTITIGNSATDLATFSNGPGGVNLYEGTHFEFVDDFIMRAPGSACNGARVTSTWLCQSSGAGNTYSDLAEVPGDTTGANARIGVVALGTGTTSTGVVRLTTGQDSVDFDDGNWTLEGSFYFPDLSTSSEEYSFVFGSPDTFANVDSVDGCWFLYDRGAVQATPGTGDSDVTGDRWKIMCSSNSTRTGWDLDGTATEDSFTSVSSSVVADTWYRLKLVMEGATKARFYINNVEVGRITTNIPSGNTRASQAAIQILKSANNTARYVAVDQTTISVVLDAVRSP